MKIVTQDTASELAVMLLQNDKKIRDELVKSDNGIKSELEESINTKITEVNSNVDNRFQEVNTKIDKINNESISTIPIDEIEKLFN